jgi:hypothetical protein
MMAPTEVRAKRINKKLRVTWSVVGRMELSYAKPATPDSFQGGLRLSLGEQGT